MENGGGNFIKGFLFGGFVGMALGMILAPKAGSEMREDIKDESEELYDKAKEELSKLRNELEALRQKISDTLEKGKSAFKTDTVSKEEKAFEEELKAESLDDESPDETDAKARKDKKD